MAGKAKGAASVAAAALRVVRRVLPIMPGIVAPNSRRRYFGLAAAGAGAISLMPSTVSVIDEGGSPSARSQPLATAMRIAASIASLFAVPSLA